MIRKLTLLAAALAASAVVCLADNIRFGKVEELWN